MCDVQEEVKREKTKERNERECENGLVCKLRLMFHNMHFIDLL